MRIIYDSALKDHLINDDPKVLDIVIPQLVAYHALLQMKGIIDGKDALKRKLEEKAEREGRKNTVQFKVEEEKKEEVPTLAAKKLSTMATKKIDDKLNTSNISMMSEA